MESIGDYSLVSNFCIDKRPEIKLITYLDLEKDYMYDMLDQEAA